MLEKNKDYVEFTLQYTSVDWARSKDCPEVCLKGYSDFSFPGVPIMDVVCNEFDHKVVVVSKRDFEALQTENEQLKKKLAVPDPFAEYKELLEKLHSKEDVEKFEWTLNHICGGKASANGWMVTAKLWRRNYETLSKLVGFSSTEEIQDYLTNEAECDTLSEAVSKLKDQVKYTCDEWYSANSRNNSWKAAAECNSPKELIEKIEGLEGKVKVLETEAEVYSRALKDWKEGTGCPSPTAAKTLIESGISWHHAYEDAKKKIKSLEAALRESNSTMQKELNQEITKWQEATGCASPEEAKTLIAECEVSWRHAYNEIKKANEKLTDDVKSWKNVTGYSIPEDYMHARISGAFHTPFDYTAAWQNATGCDTPEAAETTIRNLRGRIDKMKDFAAIASNWIDKIVEG